MPEIAWDINRIEAQAKKWQEMASVLPTDSERVAWLIEQLAFLSASHMQLQEVFRLTTEGLVRVMNKADGVEKVQLIHMEAIAKRLEALDIQLDLHEKDGLGALSARTKCPGCCNRLSPHQAWPWHW